METAVELCMRYVRVAARQTQSNGGWRHGKRRSREGVNAQPSEMRSGKVEWWWCMGENAASVRQVCDALNAIGR